MKQKKHWHGSCDFMYGTRFYGIWKNIKMRGGENDYSNQNHRCYNGIRICNRWKKFLNFKEDMYESYLQHCEKYGEDNTTIDRKDNTKGYSSQNCRWATKQEQTNNRRNVRLYTYKNKTMNLKDWAIYLGFYRSTLQSRIDNGWPIELVLNKKRFKGKKMKGKF